MSIEKIKNDIISLSKEIEEKQYKLKALLSEFFTKKVKMFLAFDKADDYAYQTIKSFYFSQSEDSWKCRYTHETKEYSINNYCVNSESEDEEMESKYLKTKISFGYRDSKYFINCVNKAIKVFTSKNLPKLYSPEYEYETNMDQYEIMDEYSKNKNIPEWLMIRFFSQVHKHKYYPGKTKEYFSVLH